MKGAPAKPMSGVSPSSRTSSRTASATGATPSASSAGRAATSAAVRTGCSTTGPVPGDDVHPDPGGLERHDDVGEEDRGVDAVAADGLQRDLAGEIGGQAGLEHPGALAELAVLGQRAPGLTHEPHGAPRRALATGGREERGVGQVASRRCALRAACGGRARDPAAHSVLIVPRPRRPPPPGARAAPAAPQAARDALAPLPVGRAGRVVDEGRTGPLGVGGAGKNPFGLLSSR